MTDLLTVLERSFPPDEELSANDLDHILEEGQRRTRRARIVNGLVVAAITVVLIAIALNQLWPTKTGTPRRIESPGQKSDLPAILQRPARPTDRPPDDALRLFSHTRGWFHLTNFRLLRDDGIAQWYVAVSSSEGQTLLCLASVQGGGAHASCTDPKAFARLGMLGAGSSSSAPTGQSSSTVSFLVPDGAQVFADGRPVPTSNNLVVWYDSEGPLPRTVQFVTPSHVKSKRQKVPQATQP